MKTTTNNNTFVIVLTSAQAPEKLYLTGGVCGMETDDITEARRMSRREALDTLYIRAADYDGDSDDDGEWTTDINLRSFAGCGCAPHGDYFAPDIECIGDTVADAKLLTITTDAELIAVRGSDAHQAVKQRCQFLYQPGGHRDVLLDGNEVADITDGVLTFHNRADLSGSLDSVAATLHGTEHESGRQACRRFMAAVIHHQA